MRTAVIASAFALSACSSSSPPADGPPAGWLDVGDGRGAVALDLCTTDMAWTANGEAHRLYARAETHRIDAVWYPGTTEIVQGSFDRCPVVDGVSRCTSREERHSPCVGTAVEAGGAWLIEMTCEDGASATASIESCERL